MALARVMMESCPTKKRRVEDATNSGSLLRRADASTRMAPASSESAGLATMASACVVAVELKHKLPWKTPASKLWAPGHATVKWRHGGVDEVRLLLLGHGKTRDCFLAEGHGYVLKIQAGCWHESSNMWETRLVHSALGQCTPIAHGCVVS